MTALPPDPDPERTPGLESGGGVRPGDTPPESGQTSGLSHHEKPPPKAAHVVTIVVLAVVTLLVAGFFLAQAVGLLR